MLVSTLPGTPAVAIVAASASSPVSMSLNADPDRPSTWANLVCTPATEGDRADCSKAMRLMSTVTPK
ncbi:hypothetical protein D3C87_1629940 [compost metagenome]